MLALLYRRRIHRRLSWCVRRRRGQWRRQRQGVLGLDKYLPTRRDILTSVASSATTSGVKALEYLQRGPLGGDRRCRGKCRWIKV